LGIGSNARYSICGHELEDVIHAIRDCVATKDVWSQIIPPQKQAYFFSEEIVKNAYSWAKQYFVVRNGGSTRQLSRVGSVENMGCAVARGVVRDHNGKWIIGFNRRLGTSSIFEAELWGILDGVLLM
ncbi:hypothetical protein Gotri_014313, partial [Gossypium trilobum]|nr:hypothetical protein [Gossypium trilobum]